MYGKQHNSNKKKTFKDLMGRPGPSMPPAKPKAPKPMPKGGRK